MNKIDPEKEKQRIEFHVNSIYNIFIKNQSMGMCLYSSVLLYERLQFDMIDAVLVKGYLYSTHDPDIWFPHVWVESKRVVYDISMMVLKHFWNDPSIRFYHYHYYDEVSGDKYEIMTDPMIDYGYQLYNKNPFAFWSEFDANDRTDVKAVINEIRDYFLNF